MSRSYVDKSGAVAGLRSASAQVIAAIRNIDDPEAPAVGDWTAGDVAAHLIDVAEDARDIALGKGTRFATAAGVAANNEDRLRARQERDPHVLAGQAEAAFSAYIEACESAEGDPIVPWGDFKIPVSTLACVDMAECLVHGHDLARAEGRTWTIDPRLAALAARGLSPMTENYVDREAAAGLNAVFDIRMRRYWSLHFVFTDGTLSIEEPSDRAVDVHISADPVSFILVGYGRVSQWGPIAKGKLLAWGRKPWLSTKFAKILRNP